MGSTTRAERLDQRRRLPGIALAPALALLAGSLVVATPVVAQDDAGGVAPPPVEVVQEWFPEDVTNYIGTGLPGWLPIYLELRNNTSSPREVRLEGVVSAAVGLSQSRQFFRTARTVEVNPGPPRKTFVYVWYPDTSNETFDSRILVRVYDGDREIHRRPYTISSTRGGGYTPLPVLVSGTSNDELSNLLRNLSQFTLSRTQRRSLAVAVDQPRERMLPDDPLGYQSVRALILRNFDERELDDAQVEAIRRWVYLGGTVILVPSVDGAIFSTRLARLMIPPEALSAVQVEEEFRPQALAFLNEARGFNDENRLSALLRWKDDDEEAAWTLFRLDPIDDDKAPPTRVLVSVDPRKSIDAAIEASRRLYHEIPYGAGRLGVLTTDPVSTSIAIGSGFQNLLWTAILEGVPLDSGRSDWNARTARTVNDRLVEFLKKGLSPDLGIWFIGGLVAVYLGLIGPGLYFFLKRINRLPWVVWLQPTVVVVYVGLIFLTGYLTKGVLTETRTLTLFHWRPSEPYLRKEAYLGIFSSDDTRYSVSAPGTRSLLPVFENSKEMVGITSSTRDDDVATSSSIRDFRLDVWQTGVFAARDLVPARGTLEINRLENTDPEVDTADVEIVNATPMTIRRGFYLPRSRGQIVSVGELPAGGRVRVDGADMTPIDIFRLGEGRSRDDAEVEDPFEGDELTLEAVKRVLTGDLFERMGSSIVFLGVLDRRERDFEIGQGSTLKHRADILVVYR